MKVKDLIKQYESGKRDFQNADLQNADLQNADLSGADLVGADLRGAILRGAILLGTNLWNADLWNADLRGANLTSAYLFGANLTNANLTCANLTCAEISDGKIVTGYFTRTRIGSEIAELQIAYNASEIWLKRGCSGWLTPDEFLAQVATTHGDSLHSQIYRLTVDYCVEIVKLERLKDAI